jgi:hypothetical protein
MAIVICLHEVKNIFEDCLGLGKYAWIVIGGGDSIAMRERVKKAQHTRFHRDLAVDLAQFFEEVT